jgi:hypothetical protein
MLYRLGPSLTVQNGGFTVRVSGDGRKCVVFFGFLTDKGWKYGGTGFLLRWEEEGLFFNYLITCRHVAAKLDAGFYIRANTVMDVADHEEVTSIEWACPDDMNVDLAIAEFALARAKWDVAYLDGNRFRIDSAADPYLGGISCGDPVSIVGLYRLREGNRKNVPIVHSGHIAALADPGELITVKGRDGSEINAACYLVEVQTLDGLSGSPVFVHRFVELPYAGPDGEALASIGDVRLLGVYQGAWDGRPGEILAEDKGLSGKHRVPVGMGLVVPHDMLYRTIMEHPKLKSSREKAIKNRRASKAASMDDGFGNDHPASDVNPSHQEDFTRLLGEAAKKRERED